MSQVNDNDVMTVMRNTIKKRWLIIFIMGIIFAVGFCGYKEFRGNYVVQSGDILIGRQVQLIGYPDRQDSIKFKDLNTSGTILYDFYMESKDQFDYEKMIPGWSGKSDYQKVEWLKKHIKLSDYGGGNLELRFDLMRTDPKNLNYLKENGERYTDSYLEFLKTKNIIGEYKINGQMAVFPTCENIDKKGVLVKYGIIGFILGSIFMFTILLIKELR